MTSNYFRQIIKTLETIHKEFPKYNLGKHISTALDGENVWAISDKDMLQCFKKYKTELELDVHHSEDIEEILNQKINIDVLIDDDDDEDY